MSLREVLTCRQEARAQTVGQRGGNRIYEDEESTAETAGIGDAGWKEDAQPHFYTVLVYFKGTEKPQGCLVSWGVEGEGYSQLYNVKHEV